MSGSKTTAYTAHALQEQLRERKVFPVQMMLTFLPAKNLGEKVVIEHNSGNHHQVRGDFKLEQMFIN